VLLCAARAFNMKHTSNTRVCLKACRQAAGVSHYAAQSCGYSVMLPLLCVRYADACCDLCQHGVLLPVAPSLTLTPAGQHLCCLAGCSHCVNLDCSYRS
jgi:hypothetical protein